MKTRDKIARVLLYSGYITRTWSIAARKVLISWCPQSNVRRHQWCVGSVATVTDISCTPAANAMSHWRLFIPSWGRQHPASCSLVLGVGELSVDGRIKVFSVSLTIVLVLIFLVGLILKVFIWIEG